MGEGQRKITEISAQKRTSVGPAAPEDEDEAWAKAFEENLKQIVDSRPSGKKDKKKDKKKLDKKELKDAKKEIKKMKEEAKRLEKEAKKVKKEAKQKKDKRAQG